MFVLFYIYPPIFNSRPYGARFDKNRPQSDDAGGSVFTRLGGQSASGGSVFHRLSGNGGVRGGGDNWHKVTVSHMHYQGCIRRGGGGAKFCLS